jgi:hypothetical protein
LSFSDLIAIVLIWSPLQFLNKAATRSFIFNENMRAGPFSLLRDHCLPKIGKIEPPPDQVQEITVIALHMPYGSDGKIGKLCWFSGRIPADHHHVGGERLR